MKATIKNGVVESEQVAHLHTPRIAWFYDQTGDANFHQGQDPPEYRRRWPHRHGPDRAAIATGAISMPRTPSPRTAASRACASMKTPVSLYYALRRNADGMYNEQDRQV